MNDETPEEARYKVRRRVGRGDDQHWEILGPRGWITEGGDERRGLRSATSYVADLLRSRRRRLPPR